MSRPKGFGPTYTPEPVQCRYCGITWTGNRNGKERHEEICGWPRCPLHERMLTYDSASALWNCPNATCQYVVPDSYEHA